LETEEKAREKGQEKTGTERREGDIQRGKRKWREERHERGERRDMREDRGGEEMERRK
jgi:hypothetical protein